LHLANLSQDAKYDDIQRYFETYGRVLNVDVKEGFGFVEFDNHRAARDAMEALDKKEFMGTELKVSFAKTPKPKFTAKGKGKFKVAFENLSESTSWQDLKDFARQAGECTQSHVKVESNGTKSGSVEFLHLEDYEKAIKILKDATFKGNVVRLVEVR
jgi:arginine/serine-rich splicing factor 4/5/6